MSDDGGWHELLVAFCAGRIGEADFHDRFLGLWRRARDGGQPLPPPVDSLFYVVEAFCPDPALRDPASRFEADAAELRSSAEFALARLQGGRHPGNLT